jgi:hypothetical protein
VSGFAGFSNTNDFCDFSTFEHGPSQLGKERTAAWKQAFQIAFLSDSLLAIHKKPDWHIWLMSQSPDA